MAAESKHKLWVIGREIIMWVMACIVIVPFLIVILNAFKDKDESITMSLTLPKTWHFENFAVVWEQGNILKSYWNSFSISASAVVISVIASAMCAFVLSRRETSLNKWLYIYFAMGLMFPLSMVTVVKVLRTMELYNTSLGIILLFTALIIPFSVFLYYGFIRSIPKELDEAAVIDGAGAMRLFFQIIFPLLKPVTATVVMINFLNAWNDFTTPLYILPNPDKAVIVQQVYNFFGQYTAQWNLVSVTILYAIAPTMIVYLLGQKYIISGMVSGAMKG